MKRHCHALFLYFCIKHLCNRLCYETLCVLPSISLDLAFFGHFFCFSEVILFSYINNVKKQMIPISSLFLSLKVCQKKSLFDVQFGRLCLMKTFLQYLLQLRIIYSALHHNSALIKQKNKKKLISTFWFVKGHFNYS